MGADHRFPDPALHRQAQSTAPIGEWAVSDRDKEVTLAVTPKPHRYRVCIKKVISPEDRSPSINVSLDSSPTIRMQVPAGGPAQCVDTRPTTVLEIETTTIKSRTLITGTYGNLD